MSFMSSIVPLTAAGGLLLSDEDEYYGMNDGMSGGAIVGLTLAGIFGFIVLFVIIATICSCISSCVRGPVENRQAKKAASQAKKAEKRAKKEAIEAREKESKVREKVRKAVEKERKRLRALHRKEEQVRWWWPSSKRENDDVELGRVWPANVDTSARTGEFDTTVCDMESLPPSYNQAGGNGGDSGESTTELPPPSYNRTVFGRNEI